MKHHGKYVVGLVLVFLSVGVFDGLAASEIWSRQAAFIDAPNYNIKLGEMRLAVGAYVKVTADDNNNRATDSDNEEEAVLGAYGLKLSVYYPINPDFIINVKGSVGYVSVLSGDGTDGLQVLAGLGSTSTLSLDAKVGDNGTLSLIDVLTVSVETVELSTAENTQGLRMLVNDLALQYEVTLSQLYSATAKIGRQDHEALEDEFDARDRYVHYVAGRFGWQMNADQRLSPYVRYAEHNFDEAPRIRDRVLELGNNDADELEAGLEFSWRLTDVTNVTVSVGYQSLDFDTDHTPVADEDAQGVTAQVAFSSQLNRSMLHSASVKHHYRVGTSSRVNYSEDILSQYNLRWDLAEDWFASYTLNWLYSRDASVFGENSHTYTNDLKLGHDYNDALSLSVGYRRTDKESEEDDRSYRRNEISAGLTYKF